MNSALFLRHFYKNNFKLLLHPFHIKAYLPMPETSTPKKLSRKYPTGTRNEATPRKSTVDFLRQFARCYKYEASLAPSLSGLIIN